MAATLVQTSPDDIVQLTTAARKNQTFGDRLENVSEEDVFQLMDEIDEHLLQSLGFRYGSKSTKNKQDRIKRNYERFLTRIGRIDSKRSYTESEKQALMWPTDVKQLLKQCKGFLYVAAKETRAREKKHLKIKYQTLAAYRTALMFWASRAYRIDHETEFPRNNIYNSITESLRNLAERFNLRVSRLRTSTEVGLEELRQLLDYDMCATSYIEVAEQHHLAWCIGRICAVRPGSIAMNTNSEPHELQFVTWRDLNIVKVEEDGHFQVQIAFRSLKTNLADPEAAMAKGDLASVLICTITSPEVTENIIFSVPHRILVIAIRRGVLEGITTIEELMTYQGRHINVKAEYLDHPVFYGAKPKGAGLTDKPMSSQALTFYLQQRGRQVGYTRDVSFYSLRRRSARDLTELLDRDTARAIMNHNPDTRTLETSYFEPVQHLNLTSLGLGEGGEKNVTMRDNPNNLAMTALDEKARANIVGPGQPLVKALMSQIIAMDESYPIDGTPREKKNYLRRVKQVALKELISREELEQRKRLSLLDHKERYRVLKESLVVEHLVERARTRMAEHDQELGEDDPRPTSEDPQPYEKDGDNDELLGEDTANDPEDLEEIARELGTNHVIRNTDDICADEDSTEEDDIPFDIAVQSFMEVLMGNTMSKSRVWKHNPAPCPRCLEDETVGHEHKKKLWDEQSKLEYHMDTAFHSKKAQWGRRVRLTADAVGNTMWPCPYCAATGKKTEFLSLSKLNRHVETSAKLGTEHDRLKAEDGWLLPDWETPVSRRNNTHKRVRHRNDIQIRQKRLKAVGFEYTNTRNDIELQFPVPHPTWPLISMGGRAHGLSIPKGFEAMIRVGPRPTAADLSDCELRGLSANIPIPQHLEHFVKIDAEFLKSRREGSSVSISAHSPRNREAEEGHGGSSSAGLLAI